MVEATWRVLIAALALPALALAQDPRPPDAAPAWVQEQTARWYGAFNAGDSAAIVQMYAPDAVLLLAGQQFHGRAAIEAFHRGNFEQVDFTCTWVIVHVATVDALTAVSGTDRCVETPKSGGAIRSWTGRWVTVYQRQPDGSWLIVRDSGAEERGPGTPAAPPRVL